VLCGSGTAGAYQAGVLRALVEAGVKVDILAAHGVGVATALCGAIDGGARLWDAAGPWSLRSLHRAYRWRPALRAASVGLVAALVILLVPLVLMVWAAAVYAASMLAALVSLTDASAWLVGVFQRSIEGLLSPPILPTIVPRAVVLAVLIVAGVLVASAIRALRTERSRRRLRGAFWWRLIGAPLDAAEPSTTLIDTLWRLVRGASKESRPASADVGRRYVELLLDNLGQPGFREVLLAVHDVDARRDLVGMVLTPSVRAEAEARVVTPGPREAELVDLAGPQRDLVLDFFLGALRLPVASAPHLVQFPAESYWRGEIHRISDRPELVLRLLAELAAAGVEQVIVVSPAAEAAVPHGLPSRPLDLRSRMGEVARSMETAVLHDAWAAARRTFAGVFLIRPDHNPIGPFDFRGVYDEMSDRRLRLADLVAQGYDDAYRLFIEPVVAAGERVEAL
jgi:hypothetical protein